MTVVQGVLLLLQVLAVTGLVIYGVNAYVMVVTHWLHRQETERRRALPDLLPMVTVQLPLYNERYGATRLLDAVSGFDYPRDRLEVQVLDDSTDDTTGIVASTAARLRAGGLDVVHLHRQVRSGFKAGALADGLRVARGDFVAIRAAAAPHEDGCRKASGRVQSHRRDVIDEPAKRLLRW